MTAVASARRRPVSVQRLRVVLFHKHFSDWYVVDYAGAGRWLCRCVCGHEGIVTASDLLQGRSQSCGHARRPKYLRFVR